MLKNAFWHKPKELRQRLERTQTWREWALTLFWMLVSLQKPRTSVASFLREHEKIYTTL